MADSQQLKRKYFRWEQSMSGLWMPVFYTENPTRFDRKEDKSLRSTVYEVDSKMTLNEAMAKHPAPIEKESNDAQNISQP